MDTPERKPEKEDDNTPILNSKISIWSMDELHISGVCSSSYEAERLFPLTIRRLDERR
jgi:hypothetical protein